MEKNIERNKELVERYPFLLPRNVFTDKLDPEYDYSYIRGIGEIPKGWEKLFLQMCEELRKQLIKEGRLDTFRFTQIKEKYNRLECYHTGCTEQTQRILDKYCHMAKYICTVCGKPAHLETNGYIASFCEQCWKNLACHFKSEPIPLKTYFRIIQYRQGKKSYKKVSFLRQWKTYNKV